MGSGSTGSPLVSTGVLILPLAVLTFLWFSLGPLRAALTGVYEFALYEYDLARTHFDDSFGTIGTDFGLTLHMGLCAFAFRPSSGAAASAAHTRAARRATCVLFALYTTSVLCGAVAHWRFGLGDGPGGTAVAALNTWQFRAIWTAVVGTVAVAGACFGRIGSALARRAGRDARRRDVGPGATQRAWWRPAAVPDGFWRAWALVFGLAVALGGFSMKRPAADIFLAGITQSPPSFYLLAVLLQPAGAPTAPARYWTSVVRVPRRRFAALLLGLVLNAPLLFAYPILVDAWAWPLGRVNVLLHCWLQVAWGLQGYGLHGLCAALRAEDDATAAKEAAARSPTKGSDGGASAGLRRSARKRRPVNYAT